MGNQPLAGDAPVVIPSENELWRLERVDDDVPMCLFTLLKKGIEEERCREGLKTLRVLRHPNILKFLSSDDSLGLVLFYAELVYPIQSSLPSQQMEGLVRGWRDVACGLDFIHNKAGLSHNNLHLGCVYIGGMDSKWKIGGFELAAKQKSCTKQFLSMVSFIRHRDAIPPEDDEEEVEERGGGPCPSSNLAPPIHSRDCWAFGNLMLQTIEEVDNDEDVPDELIYYINNEMLNQSPEQRPTMLEVMKQTWMSNETTRIIDFLSNITMKTQNAKDKFFRSLAVGLHSLPSMVVAEHIVPLLLNPLVMAEPSASEDLWPHLLCPVSQTHPKRDQFNPRETNPLLDEDQFKCHVLPLLLNLLECRDYHVRLILLYNLCFFCHLCSKEDIVGVILPEVLVGLKDSHDDLVAATLRALADLIPYVGSQAVMGTTRKNLFSDTRPKILRTISHKYDYKYTPLNKPICRTTLSPTKENTRRTARTSKASKRTMRKTDKAESTESDSSLIPQERVPPVNQYSPSASIDEQDVRDLEEEEQQEEEVEEERWEEFEKFEPMTDNSSDFKTDWGKWEDKSEEDEEEGGEGDSVRKGSVDDKNGTKCSTPLSLSAGAISPKQPMKLSVSKESSDKAESDIRTKFKGQLQEEDIRRLEEKAQWSMGAVDLFADMAPKITKPVMAPKITKPVCVEEEEEKRGIGIISSKPAEAEKKGSQFTPTSSLLNYTALESEVDGDGWGNEDWNDDL